MGWFDGWFGGSSSSESDPLRKLDPKLREFLQKESPVKYTTAQDEQHEIRPTSAQPQPKQPQQPQPQDAPPVVPPQSLYQDGRYAHLWKGYKPLSAVEAETKSDHEKLMDVLEGFKERKAKIGKAALENCADEQVDWSGCMKEGDWSKRMGMCREEVQKFERCYQTQTRLLKALGYLESYQRPADVDEQIQMRADSIYQKMMENEAAAKKAKEEGREAPTFAPLIPKTEAPVAAPGAAEPGPNTLKEWREKLAKIPEEDRATEEEALRAEFRAKAEVAGRIHSIWQEQAKEREARKAEGKETITDKLKDLVGK
ncbi:hypothetical protein B0T16DRAFT_318020 [Cercophora newfieldiana]|uniref:Autophagy protein n=1 Tax=Cercophora newfieldiana TaxID=92897 RepID=A0AA40CZ42_9PEZI|nr:hypothetical protein B0T16DRAFT_318020 [Cercophora newfieldiana]